MSLSHEQLTAESELRKTAQCMTSVIFSFFLSAGKEKKKKKKVFDYIILTENGAFSNEQLHVHFFFFFLQVNTSLRKDPCGKSTHDSHLWFTIINAEPLIQHPLSPCRIYSSLYITDKVSYDAIKWPLDFNQTHVVWRIWSLNKARKTITQLRCKTKQRLKWTPKETFLWDYVKLQTAPCFHTTGTIE